jgi:hypothetical protein
MKKQNLVLKNFLLIVLCSAFLVCCKPFIAAYDQYAYTQATSIKVDALNLMDLATEEYASHQKEVKAVQTNIQKIYEYEKNRPKNEITALMWQKMMDTSGHLFGGFINRWKNENHLNEAFIEEAKNKIIGPAFDQIAELESKKIKPSQISNN